MTKKRQYATKSRHQWNRWDYLRTWRNCLNGHPVRVGARIRWTLRRDNTFRCEQCAAAVGEFPPADMPARIQEIA